MDRPRKMLLVANVAKEHVIKFHIPAIKMFKENGWQVDVACGGKEKVPYCDHQYQLAYTRAVLNINTFRGFAQVRRVAKEGHYDVIYCHTAVGGMAGRLAGIRLRRKGTKVIFYDHGYDFCKDAPWYIWATFFVEEWLMARVTDAILCINREDYDNTVRLLRPKRTYYIEGVGFDPSRFDLAEKDSVRKQYREQLGIPDDSTVLIYLAELIPNKNQKFLIDSFKLVLQSRPNTFLVLAGFDHTNGEYVRYANDVGIEEKFRYLGWREDVGALYAMSDICTATSKIEGLGLNLVEAMYCGLPVVATENRGHSTVIQDNVNGFLVEQGNTWEFADKIIRLIDDKELRKKFKTNGYITQEKYQISAVLKKLKYIFSDIMGETIDA